MARLSRFFDDEDLTPEEKKARVKEMEERHEKLRRKKEQVELASHLLWVLASVFAAGLVWVRWVPQGDWTIAFKWWVMIGIGYNLVWSLCNLIRSIVLFGDSDYH